MEKSCSERRAALIAVLVAVPAAVLIGMLIHCFVPAPTESMSAVFGFTQLSGPAFKAPAGPVRQTQRRAPGQGVPPETGKDISELYRKRMEVAKERLCFAENEFKKGIVSREKVRELEMLHRLAEGDFFRLKNGIRKWGNSVSDLAVKYVFAKAAEDDAEKQFESGKFSRAQVLEKKMAKLDLELPLKRHRFYFNEGWQAAYREYLKTPDTETYLKMLAAEQSAQPARPF